MNISVSWNITAISFSISSLLNFFLVLKGFRSWQKQKENKLTETFLISVIFWFFYTETRAIASIFFVNNPGILALAYLISRIFSGIGTCYILKIALISFFSYSTTKKGFYTALVLYCIDIILNALLPNKPVFDAKLNVINWGTNNIVAISHSVLPLLIFGIATAIFAYKAIRFWSDKLVRYRCIFMSSGMLWATLILAPRNMIKSPVFLIITNVGFIVPFILLFLGTTFKTGKQVKV